MAWWRRLVPDVDDERALTRLRRTVGVVLVAGLLACAGESGSVPADPTVLDPDTTQATAAPGGGAGGPGTTADLDGREPDAVEAPDPSEVPTSAVPTVSTTRTALPGFGEVVVEVRTVDGQVLSWCLLLAETNAQTQRGLMEVTDPELGGYDGMLFRFEGRATGGFYMRNTPQPLSIAYLDPDGGVVTIVRMDPCEDVDGCPTYPADGEFQRTIEVPVTAGGVDRLGIEPGAVVVDTGRTCAA